MEFLALLAVGGAIAGGAALWIARGGARASPWFSIAEACGLTDIRRVSRWSRDIVGHLGALEVRLAVYSPTQHDRSTRLTVRGLSPFVAFRREGLATRIDRVLGGGEVLFGDEPFDRALYLQGDERLFHALLDAKTRKHLVDAFSGSIGPASSKFTLSLGHGEMQASFADDVSRGRFVRRGTVRWLLRLAGRLQEPTDVVARLAANAEGDPLPLVRRECLRVLQETEPLHPGTRAALERAARSDRDAEVRLQAALALDQDGWPTLEELATSGAVEDAISARAFEGLGEHVAAGRAPRLLEESLAAGRVLTARAAAKVLGGAGDAHVPALVAVLEHATDVAGAAATALGQTGSAAAEEPLRAALSHKSPDVRAAAADALGRVGTAASVPSLKELAQRSGGRLRSAALASLDRIRSRLKGIEPGRLALTAGADGQLALSDTDGRVSLPDPDGTA